MAYHGRKRKDLPDHSGEVFGRLTVLRSSGYDAHKNRLWLCQCACGKEIVRPLYLLRIGNTRSCGCLHDEVRRSKKGAKFPQFSLGHGIAARNTVISYYKNRAKNGGRTWNLTTEQAEAIFRADCHYCGKEPSHQMRAKKMNGGYVYNGIDRIDNSKGYEPGNVVPCCRRCNMAKNDMPYEEFLDLVERVYFRLIRASEIARAG
jgi:hypothetical protein